jgi:hypothetical protein
MPRRRLKIEFAEDGGAALEIARARKVRPTALDTEGIRRVWLKDSLARSVFSARTTHAGYLTSLEKQIEAVLQGRDPAFARRILKGQLTRLAYDPETGFPGDDELGIPPARPGSIRDLSSDARLKLILETQVALLEGRAQQLAGLEPRALKLEPAYELLRAGAPRAPRDWIARWKKAGGRVRVDKKGRPRLVATKEDALWSRLGDPRRFADALSTDHPPFAFNSSMAWEPLSVRECRALRLPLPAVQVNVPRKKALPAAVASTAKLSPRMRAALEKVLRDAETVKAPRRVAMKSTPATDAPPPPPPSRSRGLAQAAREAFNALFSLY